jgi:D-3-phosphoglycerate dehydrogenase
MKFRVAMIDYDYPSVDLVRDELARHDAELDARNCATIQEARDFAHSADGIIIQKLGPIDGAFMDALSKCRVLTRTGIGLDPIDVAAATERGLPVVHVPSYCEEEVADHVMAMLLCLARRLPVYNRSMRKGEWDFSVATPYCALGGKTLGFVGFGKIPRKIALRAKAFGLNLVAFDPYLTNGHAKALGVELVTFEGLLERSQYISIHAPLTDETRGMFNKETFAKMRHSAILINTSRGPIIKESDLIEALRSGRLGGVGLDVREQEPPAFPNELNDFPNIVLTPHAAYYSAESLDRLLTLFARYTGQVLNGIRPDGLANPEVMKSVVDPRPEP